MCVTFGLLYCLSSHRERPGIDQLLPSFEDAFRPLIFSLDFVSFLEEKKGASGNIEEGICNIAYIERLWLRGGFRGRT